MLNDRLVAKFHLGTAENEMSDLNFDDLGDFDESVMKKLVPP